MITAGAQVLDVGPPLQIEGVNLDDVVPRDWRPSAFGDAEPARLVVSLLRQADLHLSANAAVRA